MAVLPIRDWGIHIYENKKTLTINGHKVFSKNLWEAIDVFLL